MTAAIRKARQRQRDKLAGWTELKVKVSASQVQAVRDFVASLPPPEPPTDLNQLSLIEQLDRANDGREVSQEADTHQEQSSFF